MKKLIKSKHFKKNLIAESFENKGIPLFLTKKVKNFFQKPLDKLKLYAIIRVQMKEQNKKCLYLSKREERPMAS